MGPDPNSTDVARRAARWLAVGVVLLAAILRLWDLDRLPPGFQFDEAHNAIDAARVLDGQPRIFFPDNGGREPLRTYLDAPLLGLLGRDHPTLALRLVSAAVGILTVAVVFGFFRTLTRRRAVALLAAAFLAAAYWHLHFSRYGIRAILVPLWTTAALWAWWRAVGEVEADGEDPPRPRDAAYRARRPWAAALILGLCLAGAVYSHPWGRLLPLIPLGHAVIRTRTDRRRVGRVWWTLLVSGLTALLLFLPLGSYYLAHPAQFLGHPSDVSLAAVAGEEYGGNVGRALVTHLAAVAGMLFIAGDPSTFHNLPGLPVFDPLSALLAVLGLGVVCGTLATGSRRARDRVALLGLWLVLALLPTILSDRPPNYSRAMAALPVVVLLPALGLTWLVGERTRARVPMRRPGWRSAVAVAAVVVAAGWTTWHYFVAFARLPQAYTSYDQDKVDAYEALRTAAAAADVFLHPVWADQATIAYLNRDRLVRRLDGRDTLVVPDPRRDVVVAFPALEARKAGWDARAAALHRGASQPETVLDGRGDPVLLTFRVPPSAWGDMAPPRDAPLEPAVFRGATFGDAIRLIGFTLEPADADGEIPLTLVWRALRPVSRDLTVFVHLESADGRALGQEDREPGRASYRTSSWLPGDLVIDRYTPELDVVPAGPVRVVIGWYDGATGERLPTDGRDSLELGEVPDRP